MSTDFFLGAALVLLVGLALLGLARATSGRLAGNRAPLRADEAEYRTSCGTGVYRFRFELTGSGDYRIWIVAMPSYGGRQADSHTTHRITSAGGKYICWDGRLTSLEDAKRVAKVWADTTQVYVRTGRTIDQQLAS